MVGCYLTNAEAAVSLLALSIVRSLSYASCGIQIRFMLTFAHTFWRLSLLRASCGRFRVRSLTETFTPHLSLSFSMR